MATMFLCDHGATVIRVEQPAGVEMRTAPGYKVWDRGKRSLALDIRHDRSTFDKLIRSSDVLVETFPPSSAYQTLVEDRRLASLNPMLVHCSITAYGSVGPLKDEPPVDDLVMARVGVLASQPSYRPGPIHVVHRVPSVGAAILAAQGIVASLLSREKTGRGRRVETSLMSGALQYSPKVMGERLKSRHFKAVPAGAGPFYSVYECADGQWLQLACIHSEFIDQAAAAMDIAHVMVDPRFGDGRFPSTEEAREELAEIVGAAIKSRPYDDWTRLFDEVDVPYARSCTAREAFDNPQVRFNDMVVQVDISWPSPRRSGTPCSRLSGHLSWRTIRDSYHRSFVLRTTHCCRLRSPGYSRRAPRRNGSRRCNEQGSPARRSWKSTTGGSSPTRTPLLTR